MWFYVACRSLSNGINIKDDIGRGDDNDERNSCFDDGLISLLSSAGSPNSQQQWKFTSRQQQRRLDLPVYNKKARTQENNPVKVGSLNNYQWFFVFLIKIMSCPPQIEFDLYIWYNILKS